MAYKNKEDYNKYQREWRCKLREKDLKADQIRRRRYKANTKRRLKTLIDEFRVDGCFGCGEKEDCVLTAHHLNPSLKEDNISNLYRLNSSIIRMKKELAKCKCLCFNCHAKLHAGLLTI